MQLFYFLYEIFKNFNIFHQLIFHFFFQLKFIIFFPNEKFKIPEFAHIILAILESAPPIISFCIEMWARDKLPHAIFIIQHYFEWVTFYHRTAVIRALKLECNLTVIFITIRVRIRIHLKRIWHRMRWLTL